jgi:hypothetical protein
MGTARVKTREDDSPQLRASWLPMNRNLHHPAQLAAVRRLGLPLGDHDAALQELSSDSVRDTHGQRDQPLTSAQKRTNHRWAKTRALVEHMFARIDLFRKGRLLRCTSLARTSLVIGLINFAHNLRRLAAMARLWREAHASG